MREIDETDKAVANVAAEAFGGEPRIRRFQDRAKTTHLDVLSCEGAPAAGYVTHSTLGLFRCENTLGDHDVRVELAAVVGADRPKMAPVLAGCGFNVMIDRWAVQPGVVFPAVFDGTALARHLRHIVWVEPIEWEQLTAVAIRPDLDVHWLLAIAISDGEREFLEREGFDAFEDLFADEEVAYYDLDRHPLM